MISEELSRPNASKLAVWTVLAASLIRFAWLLSGGEPRLVENTPDDSFYYFVLAKHFAETGAWSLDGTAPATGFHLLWGYMLALVFKLAPGISLSGLIFVSGAVGIACFGASAHLLSAVVERFFPRASVLAVPAVLVGTSYFVLPTSAMEAPLVILAASSCAYLCLRTEVPALSLGLFATCFGAGLLGELSRSDFGAVPICLGLASVAFGGLNSAPEARGGQLTARLRSAWPAMAATLGALTGLAVYLVHTHLISNQLVQNSALMKQHWSSVAGHSALIPLFLAASIFRFQVLSRTLALILYAVLVLGVVVPHGLRQPRNQATLASLFILGTYVLVYRCNSQAIQIWYLASFVLPSVMFIAGGIAVCHARWPRLAPVLVALMLLVQGLSLSKSMWPHHSLMASAARLLKTEYAGKRVGAFNAGIVAYFNYDMTVNLDGLANDDILSYARDGRLLEYVKARDIELIADFGDMFEPRWAARGGYADGQLSQCLTRLRTIEIPDVRPWREHPYALYAVGCGARAMH